MSAELSPGDEILVNTCATLWPSALVVLFFVNSLDNYVPIPP